MPITITKTKPPPPAMVDIHLPTVICNSDASWKAKTKMAELGWIFTDQIATELNCGDLIKKHVSSPSMAEALKIREALTQATTLDITHIWLRSDSQAIVKAISSRRRPAQLHRVLSDSDLLINSSSSHFSFCPISFIFRDFTWHADLLANYCMAFYNNSGP